MKPQKKKTQRAVLAKVAGAEPLTKHEREILGTVSPARLAQDVPTDAEILVLSTKALDAFELAGAAIEQTFLAKAQAGVALRRKRGDLDHGEWLPWLDSLMPARFAQRQDDGILKSAAEAWRREARRWMEISIKFERFPPEALERAHTVRQLLQLADFIPEGENLPSGTRESTSEDAIISRVEKWWTSQADQLTPQNVLAWKATKRAALAERLKPAADLYQACCAAAA